MVTYGNCPWFADYKYRDGVCALGPYIFKHWRKRRANEWYESAAETRLSLTVVTAMMLCGLGGWYSTNECRQRRCTPGGDVWKAPVMLPLRRSANESTDAMAAGVGPVRPHRPGFLLKFAREFPKLHPYIFSQTGTIVVHSNDYQLRVHPINNTCHNHNLFCDTA